MQLCRVSTPDFIRVAQRAYDRICCIMGGYLGGEHTPSLFDQCWDWPTFAVLFPRRYRVWRRIKAEGKRRGLGAHYSPEGR